MSDVYYRPDPNDNWTERATDAVLMVDPNLVPRFTPEIRERIWSKLNAVLRGRSRYDVFELIVEATVPPLPDIAADWRARAAQSPNADLVIGNGRALVIEVDRRHHYGTTRKADDATRDWHWDRCNVHTMRIPAEHTTDAPALLERLREALRRRLWPSR